MRASTKSPMSSDHIRIHLRPRAPFAGRMCIIVGGPLAIYELFYNKVQEFQKNVSPILFHFTKANNLEESRLR